MPEKDDSMISYTYNNKEGVSFLYNSLIRFYFYPVCPSLGPLDSSHQISAHSIDECWGLNMSSHILKIHVNKNVLDNQSLHS